MEEKRVRKRRKQIDIEQRGNEGSEQDSVREEQRTHEKIIE